MKTPLVFGIVMALVSLGLVIWVVNSQARETEIQAAVRVLPALPAEDINESSFQALSERQAHGTLPVPPLKPEPPRNDPFN